MKTKMIKGLLTLFVASVVMIGNVNTVHATMTQDEATEWLKQYCEENGIDFNDCKSTGGLHSEKYIGNTESNVQDSNIQNSEQESVSTPTPAQPTPKPAHEHKYTADLTTNPTCTEEGVMTYTCECGDTYTEPYPALGHQYKSEITKDATCIEEGEETFTCTLCGDTYVKKVLKTDHKNIKEVVKVEPTCTGDGLKSLTCELCGEELSTEVIPATGHTEGEWQVEKKATMLNKGQEVLRCTVCNEVLETRELPLLVQGWYIVIGMVVITIMFAVFMVLKKKKK